MHSETRVEKERDIELSIVMPAYRCAQTVAADIRELENAIVPLAPACEIIVVVDGDDDGTLAAATTAESARVRVTGYARNQGKGFAVLYGMRMARGRLVGFMDAGGDIAPRGWDALLALQRDRDADIVVGSKRHPDAKVQFPLLRRIYSFGYQQLVRVLFRLNVRDTQVGIKVFRHEVVDTVAPLLLVKRFAFDIEFLAVARHLGFSRIEEAPVEIQHQFTSTVNVRAVFRTLWDTIAVFYRLYLRRYYDRVHRCEIGDVRSASPEGRR